MTEGQVQKRLEKDLSKPGINGVWLVDDRNSLIGASWYYDSSVEKLKEERGEELSKFAQQVSLEQGIDKILWHSMTLVSPEHQGKGVGTKLKKTIFDDLRSQANLTGPILYLTRIRDDNFGSQKMNESYGLARTGIKVPASKTHENQADGLMHEYWFKVIGPRIRSYPELDLDRYGADVIVFGMDGTLYSLDGKAGSFSGSSLEKAVLQNAIKFVVEKDNCSNGQAQGLIDQALEGRIGLSNFFSQRYKISRSEYFNEVWDINPQNIVSNSELSVEVVKELANNNKKLILLTSSPKIWQQRVLKFLGIDHFFQEVYTAEDFRSKEDIFGRLAQVYGPENILSIGDQLRTDIEPAQKLGMQTFLITSPAELKIHYGG